ncbi:MAG: hypothetical protein AAF726_24695 [Planctomycetota bacterium]
MRTPLRFAPYAAILPLACDGHAPAPTTSAEPIDRGVAFSLLAFASRDLDQEIQVLERTDASGGATRDTLVVVENERDPKRDASVTTRRRLVTSGEILDVDSRFYSDFLVVIEESGTTRVERWQLTDAEGAWTAERPETLAPGPVETPEASVTITGGGRWLPPEERSAPLPARRVVLHRFRGHGTYRDLAVDPDGRYFVIGVHGSLARGSLVADVNLVPIDVPNELGFDLSLLNSMYVVHTRTYGRVLYCEFQVGVTGELDDLAVYDRENDGVFDSAMRVWRSGTFDDGGAVLEDVTRTFRAK